MVRLRVLLSWCMWDLCVRSICRGGSIRCLYLWWARSSLYSYWCVLGKLGVESRNYVLCSTMDQDGSREDAYSAIWDVKLRCVYCIWVSETILWQGCEGQGLWCSVANAQCVDAENARIKGENSCLEWMRYNVAESEGSSSRIAH